MSTPTINQNLTPVREPTLKDLLDLYKKQTLLGLNCHHIGTIQSFDATKQTATVSVNYKKTLFQFDEVTQAYKSVLQGYPLLEDCPVIVMGGGTVRVTLPIAKGDQCILLFNDRDISNWFSGSTTSANQTPRLHSYADALAIVGPNNLSSVFAAYDAVRALITNGTTMVGINPSNNKLVLTNGTSLNTLLQNLSTQLENLAQGLTLLTVTCAAPGNPSSVPINAATFTTIKTNITNIATQIGNLIE